MQHTQARPAEQWIPLGIASHLLGVNKSTLREWADRNLIRTFRTPGGHRRFSREDIVRLMEETPTRSPSSGVERQQSVLLRRIRRRLHQPRTESYPWHTQVDQEGKERLRLFGRRLLQLLMQTSSLRLPHPDVAAEARLIGEGQGREMARQNIPLKEAVQAFLFFQDSFIEFAAEAWRRQGGQEGDLVRLWKHGFALLNPVLMGMLSAYGEAAQLPWGDLSEAHTQQARTSPASMAAKP